VDANISTKGETPHSDHLLLASTKYGNAICRRCSALNFLSLSLPASHSQYTLFTPGQVRQHCKPTNNRFLLFSGEFSTQLRCDERVAGQYLERSGFATWKWIQNIIFSKDLLSSLSSSPYQRVLTSSDQVLHLGLNGA
jgi:hypothetical protein